MNSELKDRYDVIVIGAGLAGLSLARHLMLYSKKTVLLLDKRADPPGSTQKVGESLVQMSGYYFSKVLDMEEHLLVNHFLKYNLRFYWKTTGLENRGFEDYSISSIRTISNIATFQLDRNVFEIGLMKANLENPRFQFLGGVRNISVDLSETDDHKVSFTGAETSARWVVDASGRGSVLKRQLSLEHKNPIRHGATWCWVEGLVNFEKFTDRGHREILFDPARRQLGHFPFVLGTNHFCGDGKWFWVIPLHGKTSLGLVYEHAVLSPAEVSNSKKMLEYVCREWPLFARDLPYRKVVDEGRFVDYSYDAQQTISSQRWALTGEAGRFTDPLYSPGGDLISIYNTLIADAIATDSQIELDEKCASYETIMRAVYEAYVPSFAISYDCLGDQEAYTLKYTWELAIYFGFYVVPMINNFFTNAEFMAAFMRKFALLGPINRNLQHFLSGFYQWKKKRGTAGTPPKRRTLMEFYDIVPLRESEKLFYKAGLEVKEGIEVCEGHFERMKEFARYILAHVHASVLEDCDVLQNAAFIRSLKLRETVFDPEAMRLAYEPFAASTEAYEWNLNPFAMEKFLPARVETAVAG